MPMHDLLHIYDAEEWLSRTSEPFRHNSNDMIQIGVRGGKAGLIRVLDTLVTQQRTFLRCVFSTHGNSGNIYFDGQPLGVSTLQEFAKKATYSQLFPLTTRMYFNGCNVADGDKGWRFLDAAGNAFLQRMGGVTFGHTSKGFAMHPLVLGIATMPFLAGKVVHFWGDTRYSVIAPGGNVVQHVTE